MCQHEQAGFYSSGISAFDDNGGMASDILTSAQQSALRAVLNRIIPADDFPSGWEAGAGAYVLGQLTGDLSLRLDDVRAGLDALEEEARSAGAESFAGLSSAQQDALLFRLERSQVDAIWPIDPAAFFELLLTLTIEGFYADPGNGGNRDAVAWRMIGFTGQP